MMTEGEYLRAQGLVGLQHVQQLWVVDLQQHAGDLPREAGVHGLNEREETLTWTDKWSRKYIFKIKIR